MLKLRIIFVLAICGVTFARAQLATPEHKIVGTWQFSGVDTRGRIVLRADHTCASLLPRTGGGWEILATGTWRVEGDYLIRVEKPAVAASASSNRPSPSVTSKLRIRSITAQSFELGDGRPMKRVK